MEPSSIEIATGSFCRDGHAFRWLDAAEAVGLLERIDAERLAARGIYLDPFDLRPLANRARHVVAAAPELPEDFDPFSVTETVERQVEDELIPWSEDDQRAEAAFKAVERRDTLDAGLDATERFLAARSPFKVTVT